LRATDATKGGEEAENTYPDADKRWKRNQNGGPNDTHENESQQIGET
jgi:hypothetical protein